MKDIADVEAYALKESEETAVQREESESFQTWIVKVVLSSGIPFLCHTCRSSTGTHNYLGTILCRTWFSN